MSVNAEDSIVSRIQRLMAIADRSTNEHEAALAASRMQDLLQEHNLTRAEVEGREGINGAAQDDPLSATRTQKSHNRSALYTYQRDLMRTIAKNNFCMYFVRDRKKLDPASINDLPLRYKYVKAHSLIGRSENVSASILMYDYLLDTMLRLNPYKTASERSSSMLWLQGCTETICERLEQQRTGREQAQENAAQTPGLVRLADVYGNEHDLNEDFRRGLKPGTTCKRRLEQEAERREIDRKEKELVAAGMDADDAWHVARGYPKPDRTPQPIIRESKSRSRSYYTRGWASEWAKEEHDRSKRNHPAYKAGKAQGRDMGLGGALKEGSIKTPKSIVARGEQGK